MKCQRQLVQIQRHQFVQNDDITESISLPPISESISRHCSSLLGHIARLQENVPAHKALNCHVDFSLSRPSSSQRCHHPGCHCNRWVDQMQRDNHRPADLNCGHCEGAFSLHTLMRVDDLN